MNQFAARVLVAIATIAVAFGAGWHVNGWRLGAKISEEHLALADQALESERQYRAKEQRVNTDQQEATREHIRFNDKAQDESNKLAAATAGALDGLRQRIATATASVPGNPATGTNCPAEASLGAALLNCGERLKWVAAEGDRRTDEARGSGIECEQSYSALSQ